MSWLSCGELFVVLGKASEYRINQSRELWRADHLWSDPFPIRAMKPAQYSSMLQQFRPQLADTPLP